MPRAGSMDAGEYGPFGAVVTRRNGYDEPNYRNFSRRDRHTGEWQFRQGRLPNHGPYDWSGPGRIPSYGGAFGELSREPEGRGMSYRDVIPADATTDPDYLARAGPPGLEGFGHLVGGLDGGDAYGYRDVPSDHALARWRGPRSPFRPGYLNEGLAGYAAEGPEDDRGYGGPASWQLSDDNRGHRRGGLGMMREQMRENEGGGRLMDARGPDLEADRDYDEFMAMHGGLADERFEDILGGGLGGGFGEEERRVEDMGRHVGYDGGVYGDNDYFGEAGGWDGMGHMGYGGY